MYDLIFSTKMTTEKIVEQLYETGDYERLANELEYKLESCGWTTQLRDYTRGIVNSDSKIDFQKLYESALQSATESIPDSVKMDLLKDIKTCVLKLANPPESANGGNKM
ncbi:SAGA complex deubiquitinating submodule subunit, TREX complex subunit Sus1 [Schizosaccharomyces pombe]|uniref:SAGA complex subunit Sus1 n=1 Tax=Schizosaccharomyces pombe (strain 972 / ATCC 24843) TaxID=284812 RepID=SUS1_SCHPO|nr:SAGA complex subunit Sus1 [Schizosaccharomyces pombe]Q7LL15.1 RecName: Full=Transcription and mRNA export factor sus1 [Schizosaccharomyces pombe 972h-]CAF28466.1 SAGA complex subunit Sus1 [Schizosaccharomyces pombe]|eukprot:NP_001018822.1 SAGA complex subunit Sus1 [Schizosaccharomyces pombe]